MTPSPPSLPLSSPGSLPHLPARILDAAALARLRELDPDGRHDVMQRVLRAFESSLSRMLGTLAAERASGNPAVVAGVAHTLKSSSASLGALELNRACAEIESRQRGSGAPELLAADIEHLHREGEAALLAVRTMLRT